jgi:hypothetical protein
MTVTVRQLTEAESTEDAAALLIADGAQEFEAWQIAAIERGESPGDLRMLNEWPELEDDA